MSDLEGQALKYIDGRQHDDLRALLASEPRLVTAEVLGQTLLHYAAKRGNLEAVRLLLESGSYPNAIVHGHAPLHAAAGEGDPPDPEVANLLILHGADTDIKDCYGETPLIKATSGGSDRLPFARALLRGGATEDLNSAIRLHAATYIAEYLKTHPGAVATAPFPDKLLFDAIWPGSEDLVRTLIEHGANVNGSYQGVTPLHRALNIDAPIELVKLLLELGADPRATDSSGRTPYMLAVSLSRKSALIELLRR
jgi:ankyrin repeat protein